MESTTVLDSAIFQLSPTKRKYNLVINAGQKSETLISDMVAPLVAHLKVAEEQLIKGGYSIVLEVPNGRSKSWFTKNTIERFLRFVSTPDILERIVTLETDIIQLENCISHALTSKDVMENSSNKLIGNSNFARQTHLVKLINSSADSTSVKGENSRSQLVQTYENHKLILQREQGMAYAKAIAAGFDVYYMEDLVSFSECFGAPRLRNACLKIMGLHKRKQVQWSGMDFRPQPDILAQSQLPVLRTPGMMLSGNSNVSQFNLRNGSQEPDESISVDGKDDFSRGIIMEGNEIYNKVYIQSPTIPIWQRPRPPYMMDYQLQHVMGHGPSMRAFYGIPSSNIYYHGYRGNQYQPLRLMGDGHFGLSSNHSKKLDTDSSYSESFETEEKSITHHSKRRPRYTYSKSKRSGKSANNNIEDIKKKVQTDASEESDFETDADSGNSLQERSYNNQDVGSEQKLDKVSQHNEVETYPDEHMDSMMKCEITNDHSSWQGFQSFLFNHYTSSDEEIKSNEESALMPTSKSEEETNSEKYGKESSRNIGGGEIMYFYKAEPAGIDSKTDASNQRKEIILEKHTLDDPIIILQKHDAEENYADFEKNQGMIFNNLSQNIGINSNYEHTINDALVTMETSKGHEEVHDNWETQTNVDFDISNMGKKEHPTEMKTPNISETDLKMMSKRPFELESSNHTGKTIIDNDLNFDDPHNRNQGVGVNTQEEESTSTSKKDDAEGIDKTSSKPRKISVSKVVTKKEAEAALQNIKPTLHLEAKERYEKLRKLKAESRKYNKEREEEERRRKEELLTERQKRIAERSASSPSHSTAKDHGLKQQHIKYMTNTASLGPQNAQSSPQAKSSHSSKHIKKISKEAIDRLSAPKPSKESFSAPASPLRTGNATTVNYTRSNSVVRHPGSPERPGSIAKSLPNIQQGRKSFSALRPKSTNAMVNTSSFVSSKNSSNKNVPSAKVVSSSESKIVGSIMKEKKKHLSNSGYINIDIVSVVMTEKELHIIHGEPMESQKSAITDVNSQSLAENTVDVDSEEDVKTSVVSTSTSTEEHQGILTSKETNYSEFGTSPNTKEEYAVFQNPETTNLEYDIPPILNHVGLYTTDHNKKVTRDIFEERDFGEISFAIRRKDMDFGQIIYPDSPISDNFEFNYVNRQWGEDEDEETEGGYRDTIFSTFKYTNGGQENDISATSTSANESDTFTFHQKQQDQDEEEQEDNSPAASPCNPAHFEVLRPATVHGKPGLGQHSRKRWVFNDNTKESIRNLFRFGANKS